MFPNKTIMENAQSSFISKNVTLKNVYPIVRFSQNFKYDLSIHLHSRAKIRIGACDNKPIGDQSLHSLDMMTVI